MDIPITESNASTVKNVTSENHDTLGILLNDEKILQINRSDINNESIINTNDNDTSLNKYEIANNDHSIYNSDKTLYSTTLSDDNNKNTINENEIINNNNKISDINTTLYNATLPDDDSKSTNDTSLNDNEVFEFEEFDDNNEEEEEIYNNSNNKSTIQTSTTNTTNMTPPDTQQDIEFKKKLLELLKNPIENTINYKYSIYQVLTGLCDIKDIIQYRDKDIFKRQMTQSDDIDDINEIIFKNLDTKIKIYREKNSLNKLPEYPQYISYNSFNDYIIKLFGDIETSITDKKYLKNQKEIKEYIINKHYTIYTQNMSHLEKFIYSDDIYSLTL